jgi:hypothetical protein
MVSIIEARDQGLAYISQSSGVVKVFKLGGTLCKVINLMRACKTSVCVTGKNKRKVTAARSLGRYSFLDFHPKNLHPEPFIFFFQTKKFMILPN